MSQSAMQKITPFLWFDRKAEEAANDSTSPSSRMRRSSTASRLRRQCPSGPAGSVMASTSPCSASSSSAMNGRPDVHSSRRPSRFFVNCTTRRKRSTALGEASAGGGEAAGCGWLKDKYGVSLADHADRARRDAAGQGSREIQARRAGDDADGQDRHRRAAAAPTTAAQRMPSVILTGSIRQHVGGLGTIEVAGNTARDAIHGAGSRPSRSARLGRRRAGRCCAAT